MTHLDEGRREAQEPNKPLVTPMQEPTQNRKLGRDSNIFREQKDRAVHVGREMNELKFFWKQRKPVDRSVQNANC